MPTRLPRPIPLAVLGAAALAAAAALGAAAYAADGARPPAPPPGDHGRPPGPPPEALEACRELTQGAACAVTLGGETLDGTCEPGPGGEALACRPARMPPPPGE